MPISFVESPSARLERIAATIAAGAAITDMWTPQTYVDRSIETAALLIAAIDARKRAVPEGNTLTRLNDALMEAGGCGMLDDLEKRCDHFGTISDILKAVEKMLAETKGT